MPETEITRPGLTDWLAIAFLGLLWGASFMAVSVALDGVGPATIAATRVALAAIILSVGVAMSGRRLPSPATRDGRRIWLFCAGMGLFSNAAPFFLLGWGQQYVTSGFAGIMMSTMPLLVLPLAHVFVPGERLTMLRGLGFGLGFAGVVVLIGAGALASTGGSFEGLARLACLAAAGCYAIGSIITRRCPAVHPLVFGAAALIVAALILIPAAIMREGVPHAPGVGPALAVLYLALGPTALATLVLVRVIRRVGPSFLSLVNFQVPVWSVVFGVLVIGEQLPGQFLAAMGMILAGLAISRMRPRRGKRT